MPVEGGGDATAGEQLVSALEPAAIDHLDDGLAAEVSVEVDVGVHRGVPGQDDFDDGVTRHLELEAAAVLECSVDVAHAPAGGAVVVLEGEVTRSQLSC